jgi:hypothetical protein
VPLKGKVKKTHHHKTRVTIQEKHGKKWKTLDHTKTSKKGTFHTSDVLKGKKTVTIRATAKGHGTSATQKVTLTKASNGNGTPTQPAPAQPGPSGVTPGGGTGGGNVTPQDHSPCQVLDGAGHLLYTGNGNGASTGNGTYGSLQQAVNNSGSGATLTLKGVCSGNPEGSADYGLGLIEKRAITIKGESSPGHSRAALITQINTSDQLSRVVGVGPDATVTFEGALDINGFQKGTTDEQGKTLDPVGQGGVMYVNSGATVTIGENVKLDGGYAKDGGSIYNLGTLNLKGTVTNGYATWGGGIENYHTLTLNGGSITGNKAEHFGGGIDNSGTLTLNGGSITGNEATYGGGIANDKSGGGTVTGILNGHKRGLPEGNHGTGYSWNGVNWQWGLKKGADHNTTFDVYYK